MSSHFRGLSLCALIIHALNLCFLNLWIGEELQGRKVTDGDKYSLTFVDL